MASEILVGFALHPSSKPTISPSLDMKSGQWMRPGLEFHQSNFKSLFNTPSRTQD